MFFNHIKNIQHKIMLKEIKSVDKKMNKSTKPNVDHLWCVLATVN